MHAFFENIMKKQHRSDLLVALFIAAYTIVVFAIIRFKISHFLLQSGDTAVAEQALWNTIHGDLFRQSFLDNQNNLREHLNFIQFLYLPFYAALPSVLTLYAIIQSSYGIAAYALYRHAKSSLGSISAFLVALFFLFNPIVILTNISAMHVVAVGAPLFLGCLIFYEKKHYLPWLIFMLLTVFTTEFIAPTIFALGVLAMIEKRSWKWFLPPILSSAFMYFLSVSFITIGFAKNDAIIQSFDPENLKKNNLTGRLALIEEFFRPLLYVIPFFSRFILLLGPTLLLTIFVVNKSRLASGSHLFTLVPVILSFVLLDILRRTEGRWRQTVFALAAIGTIAAIPIYNDKLELSPNKRLPQMERATTIVPADASVTVSRLMSYHFSHRSEMYLTDNQKYTDYIVLNTSFYDSKPKDSDYIRSVFSSPEYEKVMDENDIVVFAKKKL